MRNVFLGVTAVWLIFSGHWIIGSGVLLCALTLAPPKDCSCDGDPPPS